MPQNIFKIYDGRTNFLQWDRNQKLIVLDESITEVYFSNKNMSHSIKRVVYEYSDGLRVCDVPSDLLKLPLNLVVDAYAEGTAVKSVKFAVARRPIPIDYVDEPDGNYAAAEHDHVVDDITDFESAVATQVESYGYTTTGYVDGKVSDAATLTWGSF